MKIIFKHSVPASQKTMLLHHTDQPAKAAEEDKCCLFYESNEIHKYTVDRMESN
jgi:hypothetical protein